MDDWPVAQIVIQLLTEEGPGRKLRAAVAAEDAQFEASRKALSR